MPVLNVDNPKLNHTIQVTKTSEKSHGIKETRPVTDQYVSTISQSSDHQNDIFFTKDIEGTSNCNTNATDYTKLCDDAILEHKFSTLIQAYQKIPAGSSCLFLNSLQEHFTNCLLKQDRWAASDISLLENEMTAEFCNFPELEQSILRSIASVFIEYDEPEEAEKIEQKILCLEEKIAQERIEKAAHLLSSMVPSTLVQNTEQKREYQYETLCEAIVSEQKFNELIQAYQATLPHSSRLFLNNFKKQLTKYLEKYNDSISDLIVFKDMAAKKLCDFPELERSILKAMVPIFKTDAPEELKDIEQMISFLQVKIAKKFYEKAKKFCEKADAIPSSIIISPAVKSAPKTKENGEESLCAAILQYNFSPTIKAYQTTSTSSSRQFLAQLEVRLARFIIQNDSSTISELLILEENATNGLHKFPELQRAILKGITPAFIRESEEIQERIAQKILGLDEKIAEQIFEKNEKFHIVSSSSNWEMTKTVAQTVYVAGKWIYPYVGKKTVFFAAATALAYSELSLTLKHAPILGAAVTLFVCNFPPFDRFFKSQS
jgi:hypothetical protein